MEANYIRISIVHPFDGRVLSVEIDCTMTPAEIVSELIINNFIPHLSHDYKLSSKLKGRLLLPNESLQVLGIQDGDSLRIVPATEAG
jgi:hypothetical protein